MDIRLLYHKDSDNEANSIENISNLKSLKNIKITETFSQAIYRISPLVVYSGHDEFVKPKIKIVSEEIDEYKFESDNKFEDEFVDVSKNDLISNEEENISNKIEIKIPDEDEPRKNLDKFNFFRGFQFAFDPYNFKSELNDEEDLTDDLSMNFTGADCFIENLLGINS